jgi:cell wall-associated NlpC family hydrolase
MTKRDWLMKSAIAVLLSTSLLLGGQVGQAAAYSQDFAKSEAIAQIAKSLIGKDYKYRAEGPDSFGSAQLATYAYEQAGIRIGDTIADLYRGGTTVGRDELQAGDLVFFSSSGRGQPTFMGIYVGGGQFVYSSQREDQVVLKTLSAYDRKFLGARRYVDAASATPTAPDKNESVSSIADQIIRIGEKYLGTPYKFGSSKNTTQTFDCSSFTQRVFKEVGITLPRDSRQQSTVGKTVSKSQLKKGDLIFMRSSGSSSNRITHVAIYAGDGKILHTYGKPGVTYSTFFGTNWEKRVVTIKRVIPE